MAAHNMTRDYPSGTIMLKGHRGKWVGYDWVLPESVHPARWVTIRLWPVWIRWFPTRIGRLFRARLNADKNTLLDVSLGPLCFGVHKRLGRL